MVNYFKSGLFCLLLTAFFLLPLFSQERETASINYSGTINGKYQVSMVLFSYNNNDRELLFGYYYYNKQKIPIYLTGGKDDKITHLYENLDNGKENAEFEGVKSDIGFSGKWKMKKKEMNFDLKTTKDPVEIHIPDQNAVIPGIYKVDNEYITGNLKITVEGKVGFFIDIDTKSQAPHTGSADGNLEKDKNGVWSFGVSAENEKTKQIEEKYVMFALLFDKKIFIFESGDSFYAGFGAQVYASGIYVRIEK